MWIGTENGLNRYDGHEFIIYRPGQQRRSLSHEHINDVEEDENGNLWIGTWGGLNLLNPKNDSLFVFTPDDLESRQGKSKIASGITWDIHIDKTNRKWLALDARDLCFYDSQHDEFIYFPWRKFIATLFTLQADDYYAIQKIEQKSENEIWLGTTLGLFSFDFKLEKFKYHGGDLRQDFSSMQFDSTQNLLFFAQENLYVYDLKKGTLEKIKKDPTTILQPEKNSIPILIPSGSGLWVINPANKQASLQPLKGTNPFTLHHTKVNALYNDQGIIWIGTQTGIGLHDPHTDIFPFIRVFPDTSQFTSGNVYHVLDHQEDSVYYISSFTRGSLTIFNKKTGARKELFEINGKRLFNCSKVYEDRMHRLWVLTKHTIFVSDPSRKEFSVFTPPGEGKDYQFMDMVEDRDGNFWYASMGYGVCFYDAQTKKWTLIEKDPKALFASRPTALLSDSVHNEIWIADYSFGAFQYQRDTKKFIYHGVNASSSKHIQSSLTYALTIDHESNVWVATTSGGVSKYSHKENAFTTYTMKTGLAENTIHAIQADRNGNIWLASDKGLTRIDVNGGILNHYDKKNGLPYGSFSTPFSINASGEIIIGTADGFLQFNPDQLIPGSVDFPIVITDVHQEDKLVFNGSEFNHDENEFTFKFSALTYSLPKQVTYYYQLHGYNEEWTNAGNNHAAHFTNLSDGNYTFHVKAIDHSGKASSNIASISFTINPPFWKTSWFLSLVVISFLGGLYFWYRMLTQKIKTEKTLNDFATSLYGLTTVDEVFWMVAKKSIKLLDFEDCVVYLIQDNGKLIQKSLVNTQHPGLNKINSPLEIEMGKGIVGSVAKSGKAEIVRDTSKDERYIVDGERRYSEISVPIFVEGKVFAVIDSEHSKKNFYRSWHLSMLTEIAKICSAKIGRYFIEDTIRSKVARDLHDDIGSTLSSIKIMSNIALEKNDRVTTQNYLASIRQNANTMQESMSDMVWAINPENDTLEKVMIRMKEFAAEILEPLEIHYAFIEDPGFASTKMSLSTRKDFFLIYKEAINNAAKYSRCKKLTVELKRVEHFIHLKIQDDGCGFDMFHSNGGNGLNNMKYRANNINARLQIETAPKHGTRIMLVAPIT